MLKNRMYQGDIEFSRRTNIKALIAYVIVAVLTILLFTNTAHATDSITGSGFDTHSFMTNRAYQSFGNYLRDTETRAHIPRLFYFLSLCAERQHRSPLDMTKINVLARRVDDWYRSFEVKLNVSCESMYWKGLSESKNPRQNWAIDPTSFREIRDFWTEHQGFYRMIFIQYAKEPFVIDFLSDFERSITPRD